MAKGYWIVRVDIADPERYKAYTTANARPLARYGARFLVRAGKFENPEGGSRTRNAVIEFPSYQAAVDCWHSAEYQEVLKLRVPVSTADLIIIEVTTVPSQPRRSPGAARKAGGGRVAKRLCGAEERRTRGQRAR
jgi:uncharacterized protein (DUF1330 family)